MANRQVEEILKDLSDKEKKFLKVLKGGIPSHEVRDEKMLEGLKEKDLVQSIKYDHPRASEAIDGFILSGRGNQVHEVLSQRDEFTDEGAGERGKEEKSTPEPKQGETSKEVKKRHHPNNNNETNKK